MSSKIDELYKRMIDADQRRAAAKRHGNDYSTEQACAREVEDIRAQISYLHNK
jgi:hypothetical protein